MGKRPQKLVLHRTTLRRLDQEIGEKLLRGIKGGSEDLEKKRPPGETSVQVMCEV